jgi:hypothetical protein
MRLSEVGRRQELESASIFAQSGEGRRGAANQTGGDFARDVGRQQDIFVLLLLAEWHHSLRKHACALG